MIEGVSDFLQLDEDEFARIAPAFCDYYFKTKEIMRTHPEIEIINAFVWIDDGKNDFLWVDIVDENNN